MSISQLNSIRFLIPNFEPFSPFTERLLRLDDIAFLCNISSYMREDLYDLSKMESTKVKVTSFFHFSFVDFLFLRKLVYISRSLVQLRR